MTLQLRIDSEALAALFPEGSQARVELQSAVVAEFIRKHIKEVAFGASIMTTVQQARDRLSRELQDAKRQIRDELMQEAGLVTKGAYGGYALTEGAKGIAQVEARNALTAEMRLTVRESAQAAVDRQMLNIERLVTDKLNAKIDEIVERRFAERVSQLMEGLKK